MFIPVGRAALPPPTRFDDWVLGWLLVGIGYLIIL